MSQFFENNHKLQLDDTDEQKHISKTVETFLRKSYHIPTGILGKMITTPTEITTIIKTLPNDKTPGHDDIDYRLIKNYRAKLLYNCST